MLETKENFLCSGLNLLIGSLDKHSATRQDPVCLRIIVGWRSLSNLQATVVTHYRFLCYTHPPYFYMFLASYISEKNA